MENNKETLTANNPINNDSIIFNFERIFLRWEKVKKEIQTLAAFFFDCHIKNGSISFHDHFSYDD